MEQDARQAIVRRFFEEGWNAADAAAVSDLIDEGYASNDGLFLTTDTDLPGGLERLSGAEAFAEHIRQYQALYDGLRFTVRRMVADAGAVITVWDPSGTTRDKTFIDRDGDERPYRLEGEGVSITEVVGGKVTRHDLFWKRDPLFP